MKYLLLILLFASLTLGFQADFNHDGIVNVQDFAVLAEEWLQTLSPSVDYYNTGADDNNGGIYQNVCKAQTFTASASYIITDVNLCLLRYRTVSQGTPGTVLVSIRATSGGKPVLPDLCSGSIDGALLTENTSGQWYSISFGPGHALIGGVKYAIVLQAPSGTAFEYVIWRRDGSSPAYANGNGVNSASYGADGTWTAENPDYMFECAGE